MELLSRKGAGSIRPNQNRAANTFPLGNIWFLFLAVIFPTQQTVAIHTSKLLVHRPQVMLMYIPGVGITW